MPDSNVKNKFRKSIESLTISKEELLKLLNILQERADTACEMECNHIESIIPKDNLERSKEDLRSCKELKITINGIDGEELFGNSEEVFNSLSFPEHIASIYVNSNELYISKFNYTPRNQFEIYLDFTKPRVFDFSFEPSYKTPNMSTFNVEGFDNTWVNGVFSEVSNFFQKRSSNFSQIHENSIYDLLVWTFGFPFSFWVCFKMSNFINSKFDNVFLQNAFHFYLFLLSLIILRVLFHYFRWLYPKVVYDTSNSITLIHRGIFYTISMSIIGSFFYDVFRTIFLK